MAKKCEKCGAPIEGLWASVAGLWGVKKSASDPNKCNKCAGEVEGQATEVPAGEMKEAEPTEITGTNGSKEELPNPGHGEEGHVCEAGVCPMAPKPAEAASASVETPADRPASVETPADKPAEKPMVSHGEEGHVCGPTCSAAPKGDM